MCGFEVQSKDQEHILPKRSVLLLTYRPGRGEQQIARLSP